MSGNYKGTQRHADVKKLIARAVRRVGSQKAVAEAVGVADETVYRWGSGHSSPRQKSLDALRKVAQGGGDSVPEKKPKAKKTARKPAPKGDDIAAQLDRLEQKLDAVLAGFRTNQKLDALRVEVARMGGGQ